MGATAAAAGAGASAGAAGASVSAATSLFVSVGLGIGGIFVAAVLVFLLAYLDLLDAADPESSAVRRTLIATVVPLFLTFAGVVVFESLSVLGY